MANWSELKKHFEAELAYVREELKEFRNGKSFIRKSTGESIDATARHVEHLERTENSYVQILGKIKEVSDFS